MTTTPDATPHVDALRIMTSAHQMCADITDHLTALDPNLAALEALEVLLSLARHRMTLRDMRAAI